MSEDRERHARILCRIWDDRDWIARSPRAQWFYMLLTSQAALNRAGVTALTSKRWARLASGPAVEQQIASAMKELEDESFIVVDHDTEELLVRSYMRNDGIAKQPNVLKAACRQAREVLSPKLRAALLVELKRLETPANEGAAKALSTTIDALSKGSPNPSPNPSGKGSNGHQRPPSPPPAETSTVEPIVEPLAEPFIEPRGVGEGETNVGKGSRSVVGSVSRPRSQAKRGTRIPDDFAVTPSMRAWAADKASLVDLQTETDNFVDYWRSRSAGATKLDWVAAWRTWMRKEQRDAQRHRDRQRPAQGDVNPTDARIAALVGVSPQRNLLALPGGA